MLIMFCLFLLSFLILLYKVYKFCTLPIQIKSTLNIQSSDDLADELVLVHSKPWELI